MEPLSRDDPSQLGGYRLVGRLGVGGMGTVYLGRSRGGRRVAIKVAHPELARVPEFRERFAREVAAVRTVGGFWTAAVVDADPGADRPWLATEYVPGPSLVQAVQAGGALPAGTLFTLALGLAEALAAIHGAGLVHRDLKPSNVLLAPDGPRVIDFGIARALDQTHLTVTHSVIGTPGFIAPEQLVHGTATRESDVFCLGLTLAFAATGRPAFGAGGMMELSFRIVNAEPDLAGAPAELLPLLRACLMKDPERRPDAEEVMTLLERAAGSAGTATLRGTAWLPEDLLALTADFAVEAVDPPTPPAGTETGIGSGALVAGAPGVAETVAAIPVEGSPAPVTAVAQAPVTPNDAQALTMPAADVPPTPPTPATPATDGQAPTMSAAAVMPPTPPTDAEAPTLPFADTPSPPLADTPTVQLYGAPSRHTTRRTTRIAAAVLVAAAALTAVFVLLPGSGSPNHGSTAAAGSGAGAGPSTGGALIGSQGFQSSGTLDAALAGDPSATATASANPSPTQTSGPTLVRPQPSGVAVPDNPPPSRTAAKPPAGHTTTKPAKTTTTPPAGRPSYTLAAYSCSSGLNGSASPQTTTPDTITFVNRGYAPVDIYWNNFSGSLVWSATVQPGYQVSMNTYAGHVWTVKTSSGCFAIFQATYTSADDYAYVSP